MEKIYNLSESQLIKLLNNTRASVAAEYNICDENGKLVNMDLDYDGQYSLTIDELVAEVVE